MDDAIRLRQVTKTFGRTKAVESLDLDVPRGGLYGFIGPNGAGKTTTIRMIMSILFPDSGTLEVLGHRSALDAKDRIGYLPEERGVYRKMKVGAFLTLMGRLKGVPDRKLAARVPRLLSRVDLSRTEHQRCEELSKGMLQKIQILACIIHEPDLLILDEPFSGLDPVSRRMLRDLILEEHRRGATILFSTHVMPQAEEICEHVIMIHQGRKVLDDPLRDIRRRHEPRAILFEPLEANADLSALEALPMVDGVRPTEAGYEVRLTDGHAPSTAMPHITAAVPSARVELARPHLEDVFVQIVSGDASAEAAEQLRSGLAEDASLAAGDAP